MSTYCAQLNHDILMRGDIAVHRSLIVQHISSLNTLFQEKLWGGSEMVWKVVVASVLKDWISVSTFIGQNVISFAPVENSSILILLIGIFPFFLFWRNYLWFAMQIFPLVSFWLRVLHVSLLTVRNNKMNSVLNFLVVVSWFLTMGCVIVAIDE